MTERIRTSGRRPAALLALVLAAALPRAAAAALPPIAHDDLVRMAELIVDGKVTAVECGGRAERGANGRSWSETSYLSTVEVVATEKGPARATLRYRGITTAGDAPVGPIPPPPLPAGWAGKLYLTDSGDGVYQPTYQGNTLVEDKSKSNPGALSACKAGGGGGCAYAGRASGGSGLVVLLSLAAVSAVVRRRRVARTDRASGTGARPGARSPGARWAR
jgi:hypothetical protein